MCTLHITCESGLCDELRDWTFTLPVPHASPAVLQADLLPPAEHSNRYSDHLANGQRGWDMPHAVLVSLPFTPISSCQSRVYTRPLLVDSATPNFYLLDCVITRAGSAVALCFRDMYEEVFAIS